MAAWRGIQNPAADLAQPANPLAQQRNAQKTQSRQNVAPRSARIHCRPILQSGKAPCQRRDTQRIPGAFRSSENSIFPIKYSSLYSVSEEKNITYDEKLKVFNNRGICSGNFSSLFILPDGKVTICEELYWHPQFIIGNIIEQSLEEVWNSQIAHEVYAFKQQNIAKNSACAVCEEYEKCRSLKQVCWRDIIRAYGSDNWTYPDPNCPKSPTPIFI